MVAQLLIVEDDDGIAMPLTRTLEREGYAVQRVDNGAEAIVRMASDHIDLVILDLGLPDIDGLEVCRTVRTAGYAGGILILTARGGELDRVVGLDVGADDYLSKPFGLSELLARARALLRRTNRDIRGPGAAPLLASTPGRAVAGVPAAGDHNAEPLAAHPPGDEAVDRAPSSAAPEPLRVDPASHRAWVGGDEIFLTSKEFDVLALLDSHRGSVFTRERLMDDVWDENWFGSTKTLDVTVGRLRQKLAGDSSSVRIVSVRGVGFRLEAGPPGA